MMNRVVLVGRLTKDPELSYTPAGVAVAKFTLAVNRSFSNQQGEREADFINVVVWRKAAESTANFLKKGSLAGVDGRIQTRNYEGNDGKRVFVTEVVAESVQFLSPKNSQDNSSDLQNASDRIGNIGSNTNTYGNNQSRSNNGQYGGQNQNRNQGYTRIDEDPFSNGNPIDISDDDLPF
jgi:single-strand DNA-binding protein